MDLYTKLDTFHSRARQNKWLHYFAVFNRVVLALGFSPSGYTKIIGERFTVLSVNHPMGNYLEALYHTGFYYPFIGYIQVIAAILLLIPRTATLGAVIYFPIILNICILSLSVRFDGSFLSSPLMVLANLYLLCWDYHKLKFILPNNRYSTVHTEHKVRSNKFPITFFLGVTATITILVTLLLNCYSIMPRNTSKDCLQQCPQTKNPTNCINFCNCIHLEGRSLNNCLEEYNLPKQ